MWLPKLEGWIRSPTWVKLKTWNTTLVACPSSCSTSKDGCKGNPDMWCCHWLATNRELTAILPAWPPTQAEVGATHHSWHSRGSVVIYTTRPQQGFIQQKRTAVNRSHGQVRMTMTNTKVKDANQNRNFYASGNWLLMGYSAGATKMNWIVRKFDVTITLTFYF